MSRISSMIVELTAWLIPSASAASPTFRPETLLTSEFESPWMVLALHLVISVALVLLLATPVGTFHLHIIAYCLLFMHWLFLNMLRHLTRVGMAQSIRRMEVELILQDLLVISHFV
jgi:hypothetical protein